MYNFELKSKTMKLLLFIALITLLFTPKNIFSQDCVSKKQTMHNKNKESDVIYFSKGIEKIIKSFGCTLVKKVHFDKDEKITSTIFQMEIIAASEKNTNGNGCIITLGDGSKIESWEQIFKKQFPSSGRYQYKQFLTLTESQMESIITKGISEIKIVDFSFEITKRDNKKITEHYQCLINF